MLRTRHRNRRRGESTATVSLTPLIDTALTLLVVFMVTAPITHHAIRVELPRATTEDASDKTTREYVVSVDKEQHLFLDNKPTARSELVRSLRDMGTTPCVILFLHVDRSVSYGYALELLAELRQIESIQSVAFDIAVEQKT